jgi:hypothetical protein
MPNMRTYVAWITAKRITALLRGIAETVHYAGYGVVVGVEQRLPLHPDRLLPNR